MQIPPNTKQWTRGIVLNQLKCRTLRVKLENRAILIRNRKFVRVNKRDVNRSLHINKNPIINKENTTVITKKRVTFGPTTFLDVNIKFNPLRVLNQGVEANQNNTPAPNKGENSVEQRELVRIRKTNRKIKAPERLIYRKIK